MTRPKRAANKIDVSLKKDVVPVAQSRLALEVAIRELTPVTNQHLQQGLTKISLDDEKKVAGLGEVLARSLIHATLKLQEIVDTLKAKCKTHAPAILIAALATYKQKKDENELVKLIRSVDGTDLLAVIKGKQVTKQLDALLSAKGLLCLKPVPDLTDPVRSALQQKKTPTDILRLIDDAVASFANISNLTDLVVNHVVTVASQDKKGDNIDKVVDQFTPLLKRVIGGTDKEAQLKAVYAIQNTAEKDFVKRLFEKFHANGVLSAEAYIEWRHDKTKETKEQQKKKTTALLKVTSWIEELEKHLHQEEEPPTNGEVVEDEEEEDEYYRNPNFEFFR